MIYLEWVALAVLRHDKNDLAAVSELAHFARTPGVHVALLLLVPAVLPQEVLEVIAAVIRYNTRACAG